MNAVTIIFAFIDFFAFLLALSMCVGSAVMLGRKNYLAAAAFALIAIAVRSL